MKAITIPSPLKWLIDRRARILGELRDLEAAEIKRKQKVAAEIKRLRAELQRQKNADVQAQLKYQNLCDAFRNDLVAVDQVLRLHPIQIDPECIPPVKSISAEPLADYGHVSRLLFECLRLHSGGPCTTTHIASYVASQLKIEPSSETFSDLRYRVRKRLQHLAWEGKLDRLHERKGALEGRWKLLREVKSQL